MKLLDAQYSLVKNSRQVLLDYCAKLDERDFLTENSTFGRGSIRNLLVHIGNVYQLWLGIRVLGNNSPITSYGEIHSPEECMILFDKINSMTTQFLDSFSDDIFKDVVLKVDNENVYTNPLMLFTHVITHEFHHKGQILTLSRQLGYVPVDTDIIR